MSRKGSPGPVSRQGVLCRDWAPRPDAHDSACGRTTGMRARLGHACDNTVDARDRDTWPDVATEILCRDRVWGWD